MQLPPVYLSNQSLAIRISFKVSWAKPILKLFTRADQGFLELERRLYVCCKQLSFWKSWKSRNAFQINASSFERENKFITETITDVCFLCTKKVLHFLIISKIKSSKRDVTESAVVWSINQKKYINKCNLFAFTNRLSVPWRHISKLIFRLNW